MPVTKKLLSRKIFHAKERRVLGTKNATYQNFGVLFLLPMIQGGCLPMRLSA
jgi:hypothetical protein